MQIKKQFLPKNKCNIKCPNTMKLSYITVQYTTPQMSEVRQMKFHIC